MKECGRPIQPLSYTSREGSDTRELECRHEPHAVLLIYICDFEWVMTRAELFVAWEQCVCEAPVMLAALTGEWPRNNLVRRGNNAKRAAGMKSKWGKGTEKEKDRTKLGSRERKWGREWWKFERNRSGQGREKLGIDREGNVPGKKESPEEKIRDSNKEGCEERRKETGPKIERKWVQKEKAGRVTKREKHSNF